MAIAQKASLQSGIRGIMKGDISMRGIYIFLLIYLFLDLTHATSAQRSFIENICLPNTWPISTSQAMILKITRLQPKLHQLRPKMTKKISTLMRQHVKD